MPSRDAPRAPLLSPVFAALVAFALTFVSFVATSGAAPTDGGRGQPRDAAASAVVHATAPAHDSAATAHVDPETDADADDHDDAPELAPASTGGKLPAAAPPPPPAALAPSASASAEPAPSIGATPAPSASASVNATPEGGAPVRLRDKRVFVLRAPQGGVTAVERARRASQALERALEEKNEIDVHVEEEQGLSVVFAGNVPIVQLSGEDAALAGDASASLHAAAIAGQIRTALRTEQTRATVANTVFAFSLLVFTGLAAFLILGRLGDLADRIRKWIESEPERLPTLRVGSVEVLRPAAFQGALAVAVGLGKRVVQVVLLYVWTVFALSLFEATRGYSERISGFVLKPLSELVVRLGSGLPLLVVFAAAALAIAIASRVISLFFGSVARGETTLEWMPRDLATPMSSVMRIALVLFALLLAAPLVTGSDEGALARTGTAVLVSVALAASPVMANIATGLVVVFGRRLRTGDFIEIGDRAGRVKTVNLLEVRLDDRDGYEVRVPHLLGLVRTTRVLGNRSPVTLDITIAASSPPARAREVLLETAKRMGRSVRVELRHLDADGATFRVTAALSSGGDDLATSIADALKREGVELGTRGMERAP